MKQPKFDIVKMGDGKFDKDIFFSIDELSGSGHLQSGNMHS